MEIAEKKDLIFRLKYRPGHFVVQGTELVSVWPKERVNQQLVDDVNSSFILGPERTEARMWNSACISLWRLPCEHYRLSQTSQTRRLTRFGRTAVRAAVTIRLLEVLTMVARKVQTGDDRAALLRQASMIERGSRDGLPEEQDRKDVEERYQSFLTALDENVGARTDSLGRFFS
jgi:uncharacterized membrane protein